MTRQQRTIHRSQFEKLCFLRMLYRRRGTYDSVSCISVDDVIQAAEALLAEAPASHASASGDTGTAEHRAA